MAESYDLCTLQTHIMVLRRLSETCERGQICNRFAHPRSDFARKTACYCEKTGGTALALKLEREALKIYNDRYTRTRRDLLATVQLCRQR